MHFDQYRTFRVAAADLNGQMRGKRVPLATFDKLGTEGTRMPLSVLNVDVWGADIEDSPLVFASGDEDGVLKPTEHGPVPMPWLDSPSALVPMWMFHDDGSPFAGDPRHALRRVLDRYKERGWTVQAAVEMEFYLVDDTGHQLAAPQNPISGRPVFGNAILSIRQLDAFDNFLTDLYDACDAMEIPADSASSEAGLGQFEINLDHRDAMAAADDAWLFKAMVRGMARRHDMAATFMAKPFANDAGNGMHVHFSVLDEDGNNIFDNCGPEGTPLLKNAVAGCLAGLAPGTLIWAPHGTSYDRFTPGSHAPTGGCWAYENRTAAIRIPSGPAKARRIEHRVACGDINPYLLLSAILGSALAGIEDEMEPPAPITGNAYDLKLPGLMPDWESALERFETDPLMARIFTPELIRNFAMTKRQEIRRLAEIPPEEHWLVYLETV